MMEMLSSLGVERLPRRSFAKAGWTLDACRAVASRRRVGRFSGFQGELQRRTGESKK